MSGGAFQSKDCLPINVTQHSTCWTFFLPSQCKPKVTLQTHVVMSPHKAFTKNHFQSSPSWTDLCGSFPSSPSRAFGRLLTTPCIHHSLKNHLLASALACEQQLLSLRKADQQLPTFPGEVENCFAVCGLSCRNGSTKSQIAGVQLGG